MNIKYQEHTKIGEMVEEEIFINPVKDICFKIKKQNKDERTS